MPTRDLLSIFVRWDAGWYLRIVESGYDMWSPADQPGATTYAFFPVYPLLIRATMAMTRLEPATAGILVSTVLFILALFLIYEYARELRLSREAGLAAILLLCCAPQSFVFSSVYTESTFLFLLAAAMLALRRRRYFWAGVAAALLSGVRPNGIVFVVFALAWTLRTLGWRPLLQPWTGTGSMLTIVLAPLGLVAFWWYCFATTGDAFAQATSIAHGWGWAAGLAVDQSAASPARQFDRALLGLGQPAVLRRLAAAAPLPAVRGVRLLPCVLPAVLDQRAAELTGPLCAGAVSHLHRPGPGDRGAAAGTGVAWRAGLRPRTGS